MRLTILLKGSQQSRKITLHCSISTSPIIASCWAHLLHVSLTPRALPKSTWTLDFLLFVFVYLGRLKALELKHVSSKICWDEVGHQVPPTDPNRLLFSIISMFLWKLWFLVCLKPWCSSHVPWRYILPDGTIDPLKMGIPRSWDAWKQWGQRWKGNAVVGWTPVQVERVKAL